MKGIFRDVKFKATAFSYNISIPVIVSCFSWIEYT